MILKDKLFELLNPLAKQLNLTIGLITLSGKSTLVVEIYLERLDDIPISLEECSNFSKEAGILIDINDLINKKYILEVGSFGIDRPLLNKADYERFKNNNISIKTKIIIENSKKFTGLLIGVDEDDILLKISEDIIKIPFDKIEKGNLDIIKDISINKLK